MVGFFKECEFYFESRGKFLKGLKLGRDIIGCISLKVILVVV